MMGLLFTCVFMVTIFGSGFHCDGSDTLLRGQTLFSNQTLVSKGGKFELGFFSPQNSTNYYVGVWYRNIPVQTVVWVLNGDIPIPYSYYNHSRLQLTSNGSFNLLWNKENYLNAYWNYPINASEAVILDNGNFVLRNGAGGTVLQSFDYQSNTWLPGMKLYSWSIVSWMNPYDPAPGNYNLVVDRGINPSDPATGNYNLVGDRGILSIVFNRSQTLWAHDGYSNSSSVISFHNGLYDYFLYDVDDSIESVIMTRIVLDYLGGLKRFAWSEYSQAWILLSAFNTNVTSRPNTICNFVNNNNSQAVCRCLDGFVPRFQQYWDLSDFSQGCERRKPLECAEGKTRFVKLSTSRFPAYPQYFKSTHALCIEACSKNCSCTAFAYENGGLVCLWYIGDLETMETPLRNSVKVDIYMKSEPTHTSKVVVAILVPIAVVLLISCFCFFYIIWPKLKSTVSAERNQNLLLLDFHSNRPGKEVHRSVNKNAEERYSHFELPIFSFASVTTSTNNFSITNKLGQGGFGPVYKGELLNGEFVAVKRLSRRSSQGVEEFKNEVKLIAKLQHRNLVRILGCCNENDEMILVYEYMPNKSLDLFLYESTKKELLNWKKRVGIISGIAQGILYLHKYSRLRIVHRDLKASNILLDADMNPKISDFGVARIFGGNELEANTKRIVGTYGYMSPEYAMEGLFSMKSDMFAFGVLMLEIISGKKNNDVYGSENLCLVRYAWNLWKNDCSHELIDPMLDLPTSSSSIPLRYIQISLLCVEENAGDRPLISDVVGMLNNEKRAIATPQNPALTIGRSLIRPTPKQQKVEICSVNDLTVSHVEAR